MARWVRPSCLRSVRVQSERLRRPTQPAESMMGTLPLAPSDSGPEDRHRDATGGGPLLSPFGLFGLVVETPGGRHSRPLYRRMARGGLLRQFPPGHPRRIARRVAHQRPSSSRCGVGGEGNINGPTGLGHQVDPRYTDLHHVMGHDRSHCGRFHGGRTPSSSGRCGDTRVWLLGRSRAAEAEIVSDGWVRISGAESGDYSAAPVSGWQWPACAPWGAVFFWPSAWPPRLTPRSLHEIWG